MKDLNSDKTFSAQLSKAKILIKAGKTDQATSLLTQLVTHKPNNPILAAQSSLRAFSEIEAYDLLQSSLLTKMPSDNEQRLIFLGDSHLYHFNYIGRNRLLPPYFFECRIVGGATLQGLANPYSKTNAIQVFTQYLVQNQKPHKALIFQLGEVDCGFLIWYRQKKKGESVEKQVKVALKNYEDLLLKAISLGWHNIILCGVPLPTIRDGVDTGPVAEARSQITVPRVEKTALTIGVNQDIRTLAKRLRCSYIEITDKILNPKTNELDDYFRNKDPFDHHLSYEKTVPFWIDELKKVL